MNVLFISVNDIKQRTALTSNVEEKLVLPEIYTCQDMYILPALGTALYDRLIQGIENGDLSEVEENLLNNYITPALVFYVMSELPMGLSYQFYNKGVVRKSDDKQQEPSAAELVDVANRYKARAEYYKQKLVKYLREESGRNTFPEYNNPGTRFDSVVPDLEAYTIPIWLGDEYKPKTYEEKYQGNRNTCG